MTGHATRLKKIAGGSPLLRNRWRLSVGKEQNCLLCFGYISNAVKSQYNCVMFKITNYVNIFLRRYGKKA